MSDYSPEKSAFVKECEAMPQCPRCGVGGCDTIDGRQSPACRIRELKRDNDRLSSIVTDIWDQLYGEGFMVAGWHLNGDLEPLDSWFDQNEWEAEPAEEGTGT